MFGSRDPLARAQKALERAAPAGTEVRLLGEGQLVASRGLVPNPAAGAGKAAARVPGPGGFDLYVSRRAHSGQARADQTSQRVRFDLAAQPAADFAGPPSLGAGALAGEWRVDDGHGNVVTLNAAAGDPAAVDDVNALLAAAWAALLD